MSARKTGRQLDITDGRMNRLQPAAAAAAAFSQTICVSFPCDYSIRQLMQLESNPLSGPQGKCRMSRRSLVYALSPENWLLYSSNEKPR